MQDRSPSRNTLFDALRGLAAIEVMLFHITNLGHHELLPGGYLAVDLFFLLSGFVLWNAYGARLNDGLTPAAFLRLRLHRLYPLFAIGVAFGVMRAAGAMIVGDPRAPTLPLLLAQIGATALMMPSGFGSSGLFPLNNPAWSLSLEMLVNIAFCLWLAHWSTRRLVALVFAAALALALVARHFGSLDLGWNLGDAIGGTVRCTFSFVLGVVMARQRLFVRHRTDWGARPLIATLALFTLVVAIDPGPALRPWYDTGCVAIAFPAIVALIADARLTDTPARIGTALGELSYPLYAVHYPLILPMMLLCARLGIDGWPQIAMVAIGALAIAATLIPVDRAIRGRLGTRHAAVRARQPYPATVAD